MNALAERVAHGRGVGRAGCVGWYETCFVLRRDGVQVPMVSAMRFPEGVRIAGGRWIVTETLRGDPDRGMYRASGDVPALVTLGAPQLRSHGQLRVEFNYTVFGVAPLVEITPVVLGGIEHDALIEREPDGAPLQRRRPLDPRAVGVELAAIVARAHAAGVVLGGIRPELVYADGARCTGIAPRGEPFLSGAGVRCFGVAPCFDPAYLSPEVLELRPAAPASDVFSLCATLAFLIDGEPPLPAALHDRMSTLRSSYRDSQLPAAVIDGLADDPARRPSAAAIVAALGSLAAVAALRSA